MAKIEKVSARKILDSQGLWTIETAVLLADGGLGVASVPTGVSEGKYEAKEVTANQAVRNVNGVIAQKLAGADFSGQKELDRFLIRLDGSPDKSNLGSNSLLSVSLAVYKAMSASLRQPLYQRMAAAAGGRQLSVSGPKLPKLMALMLEGGRHANGNLSIQEFMLIVESVEEAAAVYQKTKARLDLRGYSTNVGFEGGFTPKGLSDTEALTLLEEIGGGKSFIALDVAASSRRGNGLDVAGLPESYSVASVEDPFGEEEWASWVELRKRWGEKVLVVGDDLVATNPARLRQAIELGAANAVVIKPDQIGTLTETLESIWLAKKAGWKVIVSHRARSTNDPFLADLAVGVGADYVKFGAPARGERVAKYNRLLEIKEELNRK